MKNLFLTRLLTCLAWLLLGPLAASASPFTPGNLVVARVGDGTAALSGSATAVFLLEYTPAGALVQTIALPTTATLPQRALTASGTSTSELGLTRSADGRFLVLTGYDAAPGLASITGTASATTARVIGRIAPDGSFDTSTAIGDTFSATSIRSAASADGTAFYALGGNGGVRYLPFANPASATTVQLNTAPTNTRVVSIFGGNLYITSGSGTNIGVNQVGTGLPTTSGQPVTLLPGLPAGGTGSPYGVYFADLSSSVAGVDVLYVADDAAATSGIQKYSLVGGSWVANGTIGSGTTLRGLTATVAGSTVSLYASGGTSLYALTDNAGYNAAPSTVTLPTALVTAATNTALRGIALAPVAATTPAPTIASFTPASGPVGTTVTVTGTNFTGATRATVNGLAGTNFMVMGATSVMFDVPAGASSGPIAVTTPGGIATSSAVFTVTTSGPMVITAITPNPAVAANAPTVLTLTGTGFISTATATISGPVLFTQFPITYVSPTQVRITLPDYTPPGNYSVYLFDGSGAGVVSNSVTLLLTAAPNAPVISSFTPLSGVAGTTVNVSGSNFTGATAVRLANTITGAVVSATSYSVTSPTNLTLVVPAVGSSRILVTTANGTAVSNLVFNIVLATAPATALPGLVVFPNPATDRVTVLLPTAAPTTVAIRDLAGRLLLAPATLGADHQLVLPAALGRGLYLLEVKQDGITAFRRIEKN